MRIGLLEGKPWVFQAFQFGFTRLPTENQTDEITEAYKKLRNKSKNQSPYNSRIRTLPKTIMILRILSDQQPEMRSISYRDERFFMLTVFKVSSGG